MDLVSMTNSVLQKIPVVLIPTANDGILLQRYQPFFKKYEDAVIRGFYDVVYGDQEAIHRASGLNQAILGRFIHIEIDNLLVQGRAILHEKVQQAAA
ncbi:hypothetical protein RCF98_08445 [Thiothrix lacustris]|uniref:Uncharacterized protein n=1 Tax=Thiothrix lacustris TaxID=525917 RepID=A0ABY9MUX1_9GAMM|nr:hypothetical protein [Thiothrix lacustris]WML92357.1 hypothetical protein RCF98_08445 [Thiothrix lacustris]